MTAIHKQLDSVASNDQVAGAVSAERRGRTSDVERCIAAGLSCRDATVAAIDPAWTTDDLREGLMVFDGLLAYIDSVLGFCCALGTATDADEAEAMLNRLCADSALTV